MLPCDASLASAQLSSRPASSPLCLWCEQPLSRHRVAPHCSVCVRRSASASIKPNATQSSAAHARVLLRGRGIGAATVSSLSPIVPFRSRVRPSFWCSRLFGLFPAAGPEFQRGGPCLIQLRWPAEETARRACLRGRVRSLREQIRRLLSSVICLPVGLLSRVLSSLYRA